MHLSIELLLKSWLLFLTGEFPGTHRLQELRQKVSEAGGEIKLSKTENKTIELIGRLYELRYPNRLIFTEVGSESFELAFQLYETLEACLPKDLKQKYGRLPQGRKNGRVLMKKPVSISADIDLLLDKPVK